jgi:hypothetical protein
MALTLPGTRQRRELILAGVRWYASYPLTARQRVRSEVPPGPLAVLSALPRYADRAMQHCVFCLGHTPAASELSIVDWRPPNAPDDRRPVPGLPLCDDHLETWHGRQVYVFFCIHCWRWSLLDPRRRCCERILEASGRRFTVFAPPLS